MGDIENKHLVNNKEETLDRIRVAAKVALAYVPKKDRFLVAECLKSLVKSVVGAQEISEPLIIGSINRANDELRSVNKLPRETS